MNHNQFLPFDGNHFYQQQQFQPQPAWPLQRAIAPPAYPTLFGYAPQQSFYPSPYYPQSRVSSPARFVPHVQQQQQQGYSRAAVAPPPYRVYEQFGQGIGNGNGNVGGGVSERSRSESRGRWAGNVGNGNGNGNGVYEERGRFARSPVRPRGVAVDHDHPSFGRPPHRSGAVAPVESSESEYLISNTSTVPPPPPIERSAVPLADFATQMVWSACLAAAVTNSTPAPTPVVHSVKQWAHPIDTVFEGASSFSRQRSPSSRSLDESAFPARSSSSPRTPELYYGAIGEGRRPALALDGCASDQSSPASSAPSTPNTTGPLRLPLRKPLQGLVGIDDEGFETSIEAIRIHARKLSAINQKTSNTSSNALPAEPSPAFRQFVTQILTATLVAPEDLVLALYYISTLPATSMVPPTPASAGDGMSASASAIKAAPFKLILGALMLANKTLQDNSYRNETFATVSGIPLKDVNALEVFIFGALNFDVVVKGDVWSQWLQTLSRTHQSATKGKMGDFRQVATVLQRLTGSTQPTPLAASSPSSRNAPAFTTRPSTPVTTFAPSNHCTPPTSTFLLASVNLDGSGPLRSPLRFADDEREEIDASHGFERDYYQGETPSRIVVDSKGLFAHYSPSLRARTR